MGGRYGGLIRAKPPSTPAARQIKTKACPACGNHFIHPKTCPNYLPGSSGIFSFHADSPDN